VSVGWDKRWWRVVAGVLWVLGTVASEGQPRSTASFVLEAQIGKGTGDGGEHGRILYPQNDPFHTSGSSGGRFRLRIQRGHGYSFRRDRGPDENERSLDDKELPTAPHVW